MREENIEKMDFKELRKEVQLLRDEIAIFKRKWEDMAYNLDNENFSSRIVKEKEGMKAEIKVTAEEIKTKVSKTDLDSTKESIISQTAEAISTKVSKTDLQKELERYSTISQTADAIQTVVSKGANLDEAEVIESLDKAIDTSKIYVIQEKNSKGELVSETYYYYNEIMKSWEVLSGDSIYTVFKQTDDGFEMKGNVVIDGNAVVTKNLVLSGNVTWDMENSPVKTQYSSDMVAWHTYMTDSDLYMRMSFDGGVTWSSPTKVVGTDGKNGTNGSNADVTPQNVFNALTDDGANQGIFAAFVNNNNQIYINAEYLATKIADVADAIYIGDRYDDSTRKKIVFNSVANISTMSSGYGQDGLLISAPLVKIGSKVELSGYLDLSGCTITDWGDNAVPGSGSATAVFG